MGSAGGQRISRQLALRILRAQVVRTVDLRRLDPSRFPSRTIAHSRIEKKGPACLFARSTGPPRRFLPESVSVDLGALRAGAQ